ncbi:LysR family transcriptional regulator [Longispora fulva]|uniref:Molybdate transport repressor ModE-like protein n=1 Tax=Longispora fulva TaxID=619741 RepID=A0A8J7GKP9_9ACTN|nr:LysR family transcriptional regulator [Longispora fulva]MBG6138622.1 molybdate transport repressor ModE-like protein [Longispora fulva]GIG62271.1 LysR family transcriptional regulator [Longispora fulva]
MIDVQRLRVLREVARHGSFSRAAEALLFTPSAVSQQIAALERTLGARVVERSTRGVVLTAPGRLLVEAADAITAELSHAQEQIDRLASGRAALTVATFTSGGRELLPAALTRFVAAHPDVELTVLEGEPEVALPWVREGRADLALSYHFGGPPPVRAGDRSGLTWTPVQDDPLWIVVPRGHPLAGRESAHLTELAGDRWVLGCSKTRAILDGYAALAGFEPHILAATTDYFFAQSLVAAGVGVALIPWIALLPPGGEVAVLAVEQPRPVRHIGVVTPRRAPNPLADALRAALLVPDECRPAL